MRTVISSKGQIVLPAELRRQDRIRPGEQFDVERLDRGQYLLKKLPPRARLASLIGCWSVRNEIGFTPCLPDPRMKSEDSRQ